MKVPPSRRRRRSRLAFTAQVSWGFLTLCGLLYGFVGLFLAAFPAPYWIWILALAGTLLQAIALAGPAALGRFRWVAANLLVGLAILGMGLVVTALAIAMNYGSTINLDQITPASVALNVFKVGIVAVITAGLSSIMTAFLGDRLLQIFKRRAVTIIVSGVSVLGLGIGALIGIAFIASQA
ncbi:MAG: hypothetical protein HC886_11175 [Leptolyngbyaceae cyanobacterium SM1_1_3]|nr:hypothetical protein [Leptolyngbyaceae cyanobacterium SM1_1_3]NJN02565.1 hypothetical protein [Leptolyngbyaceae cyanobacterium RM1_1_2]NJO08580.1 hypothetical protein [Leptolyngbyaceae cyanobacterium SL_1_1]